MRDKSRYDRVLYTILMVIMLCTCGIGLFGCSKEKTASDEESKLSATIVDEGEEIVDGIESSTNESSEDYDDGPLVFEEKTESGFEVDGKKISYQVPEGLKSTGITEYDYDALEIFFSDDDKVTYLVTYTMFEAYDSIDDYSRALYSEIDSWTQDSANITKYEETIGNYPVVYYVVSYTYKGDLVQEIYSGTLLSDGMVFSVEADTVWSDVYLNFESIKGFYEGLKEEE